MDTDGVQFASKFHHLIQDTDGENNVVRVPSRTSVSRREFVPASTDSNGAGQDVI